MSLVGFALIKIKMNLCRKEKDLFIKTVGYMGVQLTVALKKELNDKCPHPTAPHTPTYKIYHTNIHLITNLCSNSGSDFISKEFAQT